MPRTIATRSWEDEKGQHVNDMYLVEGQVALCEGKARHAEVLASVMRTVRGEIELDIEEGLPFFSTVFGYRQAEAMAIEIESRARQLDFVKEIRDFRWSVNDQKGTFSYKLTVLTEDGEVTISG